MRYTDDEVIEKATGLFWQKGYLAVGMRELQTALDMRPGSIYNRFKSKDGLFCKVISAYAKQNEKDLLHIAQSPSPLDALRDYFLTTLITPANRAHQRQCLLVKTLAEIDSLHDDSRLTLSQGMEALKQAFVKVVQRLMEVSLIVHSEDSEHVATWLQCQFIGLRTFSLITEDDEQIRNLIEKTLLDLQGNWSVTTH